MGRLQHCRANSEIFGLSHSHNHSMQECLIPHSLITLNTDPEWPLTQEEISQRRELARQRHAERQAASQGSENPEATSNNKPGKQDVLCCVCL
ncbi:elongation factor-like GTPase 1 [Tachysurus ichikawai]